MLRKIMLIATVLRMSIQQHLNRTFGLNEFRSLIPELYEITCVTMRNNVVGQVIFFETYSGAFMATLAKVTLEDGIQPLSPEREVQEEFIIKPTQRTDSCNVDFNDYRNRAANKIVIVSLDRTTGRIAFYDNELSEGDFPEVESQRFNESPVLITPLLSFGEHFHYALVYNDGKIGLFEIQADFTAVTFRYTSLVPEFVPDSFQFHPMRGEHGLITLSNDERAETYIVSKHVIDNYKLYVDSISGQPIQCHVTEFFKDYLFYCLENGEQVKIYGKNGGINAIFQQRENAFQMRRYLLVHNLEVTGSYYPHDWVTSIIGEDMEGRKGIFLLDWDTLELLQYIEADIDQEHSSFYNFLFYKNEQKLMTFNPSNFPGVEHCLVNKEPGEFLSKKCEECTPGYGIKTATDTCERCLDENCHSCEKDTLVCKVCNGNYLFSSQGMCVTSCQEDEALAINENRCYACDPNAAEFCTRCSNAMNRSFDCISCEEGYTLVMKDGRGFCKKDCEVKVANMGTLNDCKVCSDEVEHCQRCEDETLKCHMCSESYLPVNGGTYCKRDCSETQAYDPSSNQCLECSSKTPFCNTCLDESLTCQTCQEGYYLHFTGECLDTCPPGTRGFEGKCVRCENEHCETCQKDSPEVEEVCLSCSTGYWTNSTGKCQMSCQEGEAWIFPNDCSKCDVCQSCKNITKECTSKELDFTFEKAQPKTVEKTLEISLMVKLDDHIFTTDELTNFIEEATWTIDLHPEGEENKLIKGDFGELKITESKNNTIEGIINIPSTLERKNYSLTISMSKEPTYNEALDLVILTNSSKEISLENARSEERQQLAEQMETIAKSKEVVVKGVESVGTVGGFLSAEIAGDILDSLQTVKILEKIRYINVVYGEKVELLLSGFGEDKAEKLEEGKNVNREYGKITKKSYDYRYSVFQKIKILSFIFVFLLRVLRGNFVWYMLNKKIIIKPFIYFIVIRDQVELSLVKTCILESFTCIVQIVLSTSSTRKIDPYDLLLSSITLSLLIYCLTEFMYISLSKRYSNKIFNLVRIVDKKILGIIRGIKRNEQNGIRRRVDFGVDKKEITRARYTKQINEKKTLEYMQMNRAVFLISIMDLDPVKFTEKSLEKEEAETIRKLLSSSLLRLTSVASSVRALIYYVLIVSSQSFPTLNIILFLSLELSFTAYHLIKMVKFWKFIRIIPSAQKALQSLTNIVFFSLLLHGLRNHMEFERRKDPLSIDKFEPPLGLQDTISLIIKIKLLIEVIFIGLNAVYKVYFLFYYLTKKQKLLVEIKNPVIYYTQHETINRRRMARKRMRHEYRREMKERKEEEERRRKEREERLEKEREEMRRKEREEKRKEQKNDNPLKEAKKKRPKKNKRMGNMDSDQEPYQYPGRSGTHKDSISRTEEEKKELSIHSGKKGDIHKKLKLNHQMSKRMIPGKKKVNLGSGLQNLRKNGSVPKQRKNRF